MKSGQGRLIFFGSDDFAAVHLEALQKAGFAIPLVVAPPDRKHGRGMSKSGCPIKCAVESLGLELFQPETLRDADVLQKLKSFAVDFFVVIAYGQILPQNILDLPQVMPINVHGSLLPKYRGAAPIQWAIMHGEEESGVSVMKMSAKMDAGAVIDMLRLSISPQTTAGELRQQMMEQSPSFLVDVLKNVLADNFNLQQQNESEVTYAAKITSDLRRIDWYKSAKDIHNLVRAMQPRPGAFCLSGQKRIKIITTDYDESSSKDLPPGSIIRPTADQCAIQTGQGLLHIQMVQKEGCRAMPIADYLRGCQFAADQKWQ